MSENTPSDNDRPLGYEEATEPEPAEAAGAKASEPASEPADSDPPTADEPSGQDRVRELEEECAVLKLNVLRHEVAFEKSVPVELLTGGSRDELEGCADALIAFKNAGTRKTLSPAGPVVRSEGTATARGAGSDWLRAELTKK